MTSQDLKEKILPILKRNDVEFAAIFGSRARGEGRPDSDLDMIVRFSVPKSLWELVGLEQELEDVLKMKVDLGTENSLHPLIRPEVKKNLKVLYGQRHTI